MVVFLVDAEGDEDHDHDEDVVDGEGLFEEIAGEVLGGHLAAIDVEGGGEIHVGLDEAGEVGSGGEGEQVVHGGDAVHPLGLEAEDEGEKHGHDDPDACPGGGFFDSDFVVFLVENAEVHRQHDDDEEHEGSEE